MNSITARKASASLYRLIDDAAATHEPVIITDKRNNAVLLSEQDWSSIQETLYLLSIPAMRESIRKDMKTPADECETELDW